MAFLRPYYYSGERRWEEYLIDIQNSLEAGNSVNRQQVQLQTKTLGALKVSNEQQLKHQQQQTEQMSTIETVLRGGFEDLRAEFEWGYTLMVDRMDTQIDHLSQIAAKLDAIHRTLQFPLQNQARELFLLGQKHFRNGLLDKALEAYLKAEEKNEVDFPLQLQIGKLFLYGRDEDDDVIDRLNAEKHLLMAARYANAEKNTFPQWSEYCGQAYFHAAVAAYLTGEQEQAAGRTDEARASLARALAHLAKAEVLWPRFTEIIYTQAKCQALLGQFEDAERKLELLSDRDRRYYAKARQDGDLKPLQDDLEGIFMRATVDPGPLARQTKTKLDQAEEAAAWARKAEPTAKEDLSAINSIELRFAGAKRLLPGLEVDIEGLNEKLCQVLTEFEDITERSFKTNSEKAKQAVTSTEGRIASCQSQIERLKQQMKSTSGAGVGCLVGIVAVFGVSAFVAPVVRALIQSARSSPELGMLLFCIEIVACIIAGVLGALARRNYKNQAYRDELENNTRTLNECVRTLPSLEARERTWVQEMQNYGKWKSRSVYRTA